MIQFLLRRPIAVFMAFTACFLLGLVTYFTLPVSLLPDIAIPEITVQVNDQQASARELENTVVKPIRQQLAQVAGLSDIHSETRDGAGLIRLSFDFGTNTDLAFIEVNEKIDAAMNNLPREVDRPRVVKASATDVPVFYLNLTLREAGDETAFLTLCQFAETVIKRRIEQLPEVAMVDVTGLLEQELRITPDMEKLRMADLSQADLEEALATYNVEPGNLTIRDGYYEYNVKISSLLRTADDVRNIYLKSHDRLYQFKDLAQVEVVSRQPDGYAFADGKRAVTLSIIKQSDENMADMKEALAEVTDYFSEIYPDIKFTITRDQTELLDYTISNLKQNLSLGFLFIFIVAILFLGDMRSPIVIGLSMTVSIVTSFLFFYLFNMSLNIISLSGLILALGMMIDSSIIVTENIAQWRAKGYSLEDACAKGTSEVITPMLSSTLTTIAVFVPLVFMSGIAGAIFYDQAFAVTVGLMVSYFTGIMLLPVLYKLVYSIPEMKKTWLNIKINNLIKEHTMDRFYDSGVDFVFRHKKSSLILSAITIPMCVVLFYAIPKSRMPDIDQNELIAHLEWNENIHLDENRSRIASLMEEAEKIGAQHTAYIGQQQFLLNRDRELSISEAELYFKTQKTDQIAPLQESLTQWIRSHYPMAVVSFAPPETVFEKMFDTGEADIETQAGEVPVGVAFDNQLNISIDNQKLLLYNVSYDEVYRTLKTAFKENEIATLRSYQQYLPITLAGTDVSIEDILQRTLIRTTVPVSDESEETEVNYIPLRSLVRVTPGEDLKTLTAGKNGEFVPFSFYDVKNAEELMGNIRNIIQSDTKYNEEWDLDFTGSFFSNQQMLNELVVILFISILLMYFILASQFESFLQPLIVLSEIPIDVAASLITLWVFGHTLNLMSAIGIVVTCGIIINDSILKLDMINELRKDGWPLLEAIHEGGRRRLRPIVMTSLTTIFGMVPLLFSFDMGSELQKPLSIAMISAMLIGTAVSLFVVPLVYWYIYRKHDTSEQHK